MKPLLILFYTKMFRIPLHLEQFADIEGVEFTEDKSRFKEADAVIFHIPEWSWKFPIKQKGQLWVAWSKESHINYPKQAARLFMHFFDLTMNYKLDSDVFTGYVPEELYDIESINFSDELPKELICSFISGNVDNSGRLAYLKELAQYLDIHQYGNKGNRKISNDNGYASKVAKISEYKFTVAFENSICDDYVTEKFYQPLIAGSIPVYMGAANIDKFKPVANCCLNVNDYESPLELAQEIRILAEDVSKYNELRHWYSQQIKDEFKQLLDLDRVHAFRRLAVKIKKMKQCT